MRLAPPSHLPGNTSIGKPQLVVVVLSCLLWGHEPIFSVPRVHPARTVEGEVLLLPVRSSQIRHYYCRHRYYYYYYPCCCMFPVGAGGHDQNVVVSTRECLLHPALAVASASGQLLGVRRRVGMICVLVDPRLPCVACYPVFPHRPMQKATRHVCSPRDAPSLRGPGAVAIDDR